MLTDNARTARRKFDATIDAIEGLSVRRDFDTAIDDDSFPAALAADTAPGPGLGLANSPESFLESDASVERSARYKAALASDILQDLEPEVSHTFPPDLLQGLEHEASKGLEPEVSKKRSHTHQAFPKRSDSSKAIAKDEPKQAESMPLAPANITEAAETPSFTQRFWTPVAKARTYILQAPGVLILVLVMLASSGVAFFAVGKIASTQGEDARANHPRILAKPSFTRPGPGSTDRIIPGFVSTMLPEGSPDTLRPMSASQLMQTPHREPHWFSRSTPGGEPAFTPWGEPLPASHYLCQGLVVPRKSECILAVPLIDGASSSGIIRDLAGQPALQVEWKPSGAGRNGLEQHPAVVLRACHMSGESSASQKILAYCKVERRTMGSTEARDRAYIYHAGGNLFGTLSARVERGIPWTPGSSVDYVLATTRGSIRLSLEGDFQQHAVNIWSDDSRLLFGDSSPECRPSFDTAGKYWQLRVLANMDVCLLLAALLCAEVLEGSH